MMSHIAGTIPAISYAVSGRAMPGQSESGDGYVVIPGTAGTLVAVVDGLGHGPLAAAATKAAQASLTRDSDTAGSDLSTLVRNCHSRLLATRGAVMTLMLFSATSPTLTWLGVGNVAGALLPDDGRRDSPRVVLRGGVVGGTLPSLHCSTVALNDGDLVMLATDGIASRFCDDIDRQLEPTTIAENILAGFAKNSDDALVLVARWNGRP